MVSSDLPVVKIDLKQIVESEAVIYAIAVYNQRFAQSPLTPDEKEMLILNPLVLRNLWGCLELNEFEKYKLKKQILHQLQETPKIENQRLVDLVSQYLEKDVFS